MTTDEIVSASVFMMLNAPTGDDKLTIAEAIIREVADHLEDTNLGNLLRKALAQYGPAED